MCGGGPKADFSGTHLTGKAAIVCSLKCTNAHSLHVRVI